MPNSRRGSRSCRKWPLGRAGADRLVSVHLSDVRPIAQPGDRIERTRAIRKLIVSTFLTLDGVMQAPGGPGEDEDGGFAHGGWSVNYWDEQMGEGRGEAMRSPLDVLRGRKTYDLFAA